MRQTAGIDVLECRITHVAHAPEIAEAMLRRQQASAIVAARRTIVAGAVGLVEMALRQIGEDGIVDLDEERGGGASTPGSTRCASAGRPTACAA